MAEYFAGGHLRFVNGAWRDDAGDVIEIARVRNGRWILRKTGDIDWEQYYTCSNCGDRQYWESHFCPNCGAKMGKEDADNGC